METQITQEVEQSTQRALTVLDQANSLTISTILDYMVAQGLMKTVKDRIKELNDTRMAQTRPLDESKAKIIAFFASPLEKLEKAKLYLNGIMVAYTEDQERSRREEERRLNEEKRKREEEDALSRALEAEAAGEKEEAEQILEEPSNSAPVKLNSSIPKSKESHIRETWSAEVISLADLIKGIVEGKAPIMAVKADMPFLNEQARSYKQTLKIAGVRPVSKKTQI